MSIYISDKHPWHIRQPSKDSEDTQDHAARAEGTESKQIGRSMHTGDRRAHREACESKRGDGERQQRHGLTGIVSAG